MQPDIGEGLIRTTTKEKFLSCFVRTRCSFCLSTS